MDEQKNNYQGEKSISTTVGVVILLLIAAIVCLVVWKFNSDSASVSNVPVVSVPVKVEKTPELKTEVPANTDTTTDATTNQAVTTRTPIDFDKEIKDLDSASSAVSSDDFGDSGLSNANLGL
jgi:flagellar basal body-associated protein FliL